MRIINIQDTSVQISQAVLLGVVKLFCSGNSIQNFTSYRFDGGYYSQDILQQYSSVSNVKSIKF